MLWSPRRQADWLPVLSIGLIVRSGVIIGRLGANLRKFAFGAPVYSRYLERLKA